MSATVRMSANDIAVVEAQMPATEAQLEGLAEVVKEYVLVPRDEWERVTGGKQ